MFLSQFINQQIFNWYLQENITKIYKKNKEGKLSQSIMKQNKILKNY